MIVGIIGTICATYAIYTNYYVEENSYTLSFHDDDNYTPKCTSVTAIHLGSFLVFVLSSFIVFDELENQDDSATKASAIFAIGMMCLCCILWIVTGTLICQWCGRKYNA